MVVRQLDLSAIMVAVHDALAFWCRGALNEIKTDHHLGSAGRKRGSGGQDSGLASWDLGRGRISRPNAGTATEVGGYGGATIGHGRDISLAKLTRVWCEHLWDAVWPDCRIEYT